MNQLSQLFTHFECHNVEGIREAFAGGINPNTVKNDGEPLLYGLINMYSRSPKFKDCVKAFVDYGLVFHDIVLLSVLLNDAAMLDALLNQQPEAASKKYTLQCTYTPLFEASLLHICAEYNCVACADVLVKYGADVNEKAGIDEYGFGGQTPIFHTVNQNGNQSADMLAWLLAKGADLGLTLRGLVWGKGYDWETLMPAVNPISYAMMGFLPQVHRNEKTVAGIVTLLLKQAYGFDYTPANVPCKYLLS